MDSFGGSSSFNPPNESTKSKQDVTVQSTSSNNNKTSSSSLVQQPTNVEKRITRQSPKLGNLDSPSDDEASSFNTPNESTKSKELKGKRSKDNSEQNESTPHAKRRRFNASPRNEKISDKTKNTATALKRSQDFALAESSESYAFSQFYFYGHN